MVYLAICVLFVATVAYAATWGAFGGTEKQVEQSTDTVPSAGEESCKVSLQNLHTQMVSRALSGIDTADAKGALEAWRNWSIAWRKQLNRLRRRCAGSTDADSPPPSIFRDVERLHRAYDTSLTGFIELGRKPLSRVRPYLLRTAKEAKVP